MIQQVLSLKFSFHSLNFALKAGSNDNGGELIDFN